MNVQEVEIGKIKQLENIRLRIEEKDVHTLMSSIRQDGLLHPIGVSYLPGKTDEYYVVYGNRRLEACRKLNWQTIPANILPSIELKDFLLKNTLENIERSELSESEMGRLFATFNSEYDMTPSEIASRFNLSVNRVKRCISIYHRIPESHREKVSYLKDAGRKSGRIPAYSADKIISLTRQYRLNKEQMISLLDEAKKDEFSIRHIEIVASLLGEGYPVEEAIPMTNEYQLLQVRLPIKKKDVISLKKRHKLPMHKIVAGILRGDIKEKLDIPTWEKGG